MFQVIKKLIFVNNLFTIFNKSLFQVLRGFLSKCTNILINTNII